MRGEVCARARFLRTKALAIFLHRCARNAGALRAISETIPSSLRRDTQLRNLPRSCEFPSVCSFTDAEAAHWLGLQAFIVCSYCNFLILSECNSYLFRKVEKVSHLLRNRKSKYISFLLIPKNLCCHFLSHTESWYKRKNNPQKSI